MKITATSAFAPAQAAPPKITGEVFSFAGSGMYSQGSVHSTGDVVGRAGGYPTFADAQRGAIAATRGERRPAAGIFEQGGVFHARSLTAELTYDDQLGGETGPWHFEGREDPINGDIGEFKASQGLRFVVDGASSFDVASVTSP